MIEFKLWKEFMEGKISWWEYIQKHMFEEEPPFHLAPRPNKQEKSN